MLLIGSHVNFKKDDQLLGSLKQALSYGANTFMFYTGAPQNTKRYPIEDGLTLAALQLMKEENIDYSKVVVHAPYIVNLANDSDPVKYKFSVDFLQEEIERCKLLGITKLVLHPGSHVGLGVDRAIANISNAINMISNDSVVILLETMAGKGTEVGSKLEEIKAIIDKVEDKEHIGVCLDTCHLNDGGYDIANFDEILNRVDRIIGLNKVGCVHINDSKNECGAHKDRHENFGFGRIGFDNLIKVIYNERLKDVPKILETPYVDKDFAPYKYEIEMIRSRKFDPDLIEKIRNQN
ncbi:MAG: deoxyribonuclease IV [Mycoplasmatota bacterium]|nr:deoxyribonuclease IV [Mycoplasmatota bacterium]